MTDRVLGTEVGSVGSMIEFEAHRGFVGMQMFCARCKGILDAHRSQSIDVEHGGKLVFSKIVCRKCSPAAHGGLSFLPNAAALTIRTVTGWCFSEEGMRESAEPSLATGGDAPRKDTSMNEEETATPTGLTVADAKKLCGALRRAQYSVSWSDDRLNLRAFRVERDMGGEDAVIVTTDGHRLTVARVTGLRLPRDWSVPLTNKRELRTLVTMPTAMLSALADADRAWAEPDRRGQSTFSRQSFPDWRQVVPSSHAWSTKVMTASLKEALAESVKALKERYVTRRETYDGRVLEHRATVKAAMAACKDAREGEGRPNAMEYRKLTVAKDAAKADAKKHREAAPSKIHRVAVVVHPDSTALDTCVKDRKARRVETFDSSGSCTVGLNTSFLLDALKACGAGDGSTTIEGNDELAPVRVYSDLADGFMVVMPMRPEKDEDDS